MEAHEVAHQWWGNVVIPSSYQDEWLSEALANYSALLFLEKQQGAKAMEDVLEDYRDELMVRDSSGATVESSGPITWGFRLDGTGNLDAWHHITYYKGAWILHMLRQRMGEERFLKMLGELRRRYDSRTLSTAQFEAVVKDFAPPRGSAPGGKPLDVDEFFENWVYGTGIPELKVAYSAKVSAAGVRVSGTVTQSGVEDGFSAQVPVEIRFAKGPSQIVWVETSNGETSFSKLVQQTPVKVSIPSGRLLAARK
jgi:aminopeptidase N